MSDEDQEHVTAKLAEAWDEGYAAGRSDEFAANKGFTGYHANPHRNLHMTGGAE